MLREARWGDTDVIIEEFIHDIYRRKLPEALAHITKQPTEEADNEEGEAQEGDGELKVMVDSYILGASANEVGNC